MSADYLERLNAATAYFPSPETEAIAQGAMMGNYIEEESQDGEGDYDEEEEEEAVEEADMEDEEDGEEGEEDDEQEPGHPQ